MSENKNTMKKTCARCQREFEDARPYAKICPRCRLTPGPKNHLAIDMNAPKRNRKNLFLT